MELCYNTVQLLGYEQCFWRTTGVQGVEDKAKKGKGKMGDFSLRPPDDSFPFSVKLSTGTTVQASRAQVLLRLP